MSAPKHGPLASWPSAHRDTTCQVCHESVARSAIVDLLYGFVACGCEKHEYEHLVEVIYHRACFARLRVMT